MMINESQVNKIPLDLTLYDHYEIPQDFMAFEIHFSDVSQMQCDELEHDYYINGYKIFHTELQRSSGDLFHYKLIVAKAPLLFSGSNQSGN